MSNIYSKEVWLKVRANELYAKRTHAELCLSKRLSEWFPDMQIQEQTVILGYIADFYIPHAALIVEADGCVHDSESAKHHDAKRNKELASAGITTLRIKNSTILNRPKATRNAIAETIKQKTGFLPCEVKKTCEIKKRRKKHNIVWDEDLCVK